MASRSPRISPSPSYWIRVIAIPLIVLLLLAINLLASPGDWWVQWAALGIGLTTSLGHCIGMGQAPPSGGVTVRTMNRNFKGRCGTKDAGAYLVSPETAAATALVVASTASWPSVISASRRTAIRAPPPLP